MRRIILNVILIISFISSGNSVWATDFADPLTLDACVNIALENNIGQMQSDLSVERTRKNTTRAFSNFLPSIGLSSSFQKSGGKSIIALTSYDSTVTRKTEGENSSLGFSFSQTLFNKYYLSNWSYAKHNVNSAELNNDYARRGLILSVKEQYFEVLKMKKLLAVSQEDLALSEKQLELADALNQVGSAARSDVLRAKATVAQKKLNLLTAQNRVNLALADLAATLGIDVNAVFDVENQEPLWQEEAIEFDVPQMINTAYQHRLDLQAIEQDLESAKSSYGMAFSGYLPQINFSAQYNYYDDAFKMIGENTDWSYGVRLDYNLFDGFDREASVSQARLDERLAKKEIAQKKLDIALQVKQATLNFKTAIEKIKQADESLKAAEEDLRLAEERYKLGVATIVDLNTAQLGYTNAKTSYVEAIYDHELQKAQLDYVMGK